jgi:gamma-tubulin complex component 5
MAYCSIFVLLMQIRRAKTSIDRTLLDGPVQPSFGMEEADVNSLYALRGKFTWFIKYVIIICVIYLSDISASSFMNFVVTHVGP